MVSLGIVKPLNSTSLFVACGTDNGAEIPRRSVISKVP